MKRVLLSMALLLAFCVPWTHAQTSLPFTDDFEGGNNWTFINGTQTNKWCIGNATNDGGVSSMYISNDGGASNVYYINSTTAVFAYKEFTLPAGFCNISYSWKCDAEINDDYLRVVIAPSSESFTAGTPPSGLSYNSIPTGWIAADGGSQLNLSYNWQTYSADINITTAGTYKVAFIWINDASSGAQPPAAIDNFSISMTSCYMPTGLTTSNPTTNSIDFSWTASGHNEIGYQYVYVESGGTPDWSSPNNTTATSCTVSGLDPNKNYDFYVRSSCSATDQSFSAKISARTACVALTASDLPYVDGFEDANVGNRYSVGGFVPCWGHINDANSFSNPGFPYVNSSHGRTGKCLNFYQSYLSNYPTNQIAVLPELASSLSANEVSLKFWARKTTTLSGDMQVGVMTDPTDASTFTSVETVTTTTSYAEYEVLLSAYTGTGQYVAIRCPLATTSNTMQSIYVDDVTLSLIPICQPVKTLTATATRTSVTANWSLKTGVTNCVGYEVKLSSNSDPDAAAIETQIISNPATLTYTFEHLDRITTYYVHVRTNCGSTDGYGEWTTITVTTKDVDPDCTGINPQVLVTGTSANKQVPMHNWFHSTYSQQIFTAAELSALGFEAGYISSIAIQYKLSAAYTKDVTVYMGLTTATTMTSAFLPVKQCSETVSTLFNTADKWYDFQMTDPLYWDGTSNVVVGMMFEGGTCGNPSDLAFAGGTTSGNMSTFSTSDSDTPSMTSGDGSNQRANMKFQICPLSQACPAVDTVFVSDSVLTSATVSWTAATGDFANTYDLVVSTTPVTDFSTVTPRHSGLTGTTDTLMGLLPYTDYYVYVRVNCNAYGKTDGEAWSEAVHFKTLYKCIPPYNLAMKLRSKSSGMVTWTGTEQANNYRYILSETEVADPDNAPTTATGITADSLLLTGLTPETHYYFYLSNECGGTDGNSPYMLLEFTTPEACVAPEDINITDIQKYQMTLNWTADTLLDPTDAFDIYVSTTRVTEFEGLVPTYTGVTGNSKVLDTLQRNTLYYVYLRANCGDSTTTWEEVTATTEDLSTTCDSAFTITIGTGSEGSFGPVNDLYAYERNIYLFTSADGLKASELSTISWQFLSSRWIPAKIYLKNTTLTDLSSLYADSWNNNIADATLVYDGTILTLSSGWTTMDITDFNYTGNNLIVLVASNYGRSSYTSVQALHHPGPPSSHCYVRKNSNIDDNNVMSTFNIKSIESYRHNIKFGYCVKEACPTLKYGPKPINITDNDATLEWHLGKGDWSSTYTILYAKEPITDFANLPASADSVVNIPDTTYTFTNLEANTHYWMYVRVNCINEKYNDGISGWSRGCDFETEFPCLKPTDFVLGDYTSNSVNLSWVEKNGAEDWNIIKNTNGDYDTIAVNKSQCTYSGDTIRYTLTGLQPATNYKFLLQANCQEDSLSKMAVGAPSVHTFSNATDIDTIVVNSFKVIGDVNIDRNNKVITIKACKGSDLTNVAFSTQYAHSACKGYVGEAEFTSPWNFSSDVTVRVFAQDTNIYADWTISMFEEECATPYDFTITDIQHRSAVLKWNVGDASTSFDLVVSPTELTDPSTDTIQNITVTNVDGACTYTLTKLDRGNTYYVYVRTNCGTSFGQWRGDNFTTTGLLVCENKVVNNGTDTCSYVPLNGFAFCIWTYWYKSQFIYTSDKLDSLRGKTIGKMTFFAQYDSIKSFRKSGIEVSIGITTANNLSSGYDTEPALLVHKGTINMVDNNWIIDFGNNKFYYPETGGNIIIQMKEYDAEWYGMGTPVFFYGTYGNTGMSRYTVRDESSCNFLPKVEFEACQGNTCPDIDSVWTSDVLTNGLTVTWNQTKGDYPGTTEIKVSQTKYSDPAREITTADYTTEDTTYVLTGLTPYTRYYIYVRTLCNGDGQQDGRTNWIMTDTITESVCEYPHNVVATMTSKTSARLTWTDVAGMTTEGMLYVYAYSTVEGEPTSSSVSFNGYADLTGLANSTKYYCYVRKSCDDGTGSSPWRKTTITTVPALPAVINITPSNIAFNAFTVTWESDTAKFANETQWEVSVVPWGETPTDWETVYSREYFATGLISHKSYEIYVRAKSGSECSEAEHIMVTTAYYRPQTICSTHFDGTGTSTNSPITSEYLALQGRTYTILPADSLTEYIGKFFESITFYIQKNIGYAESLNIFKLYLKEVTETTISAPIAPLDTTSATLVFDGQLPELINAGPLEIPFHTGYQYHGGNLLIAFQSPTVYSYGALPCFYGDTTVGSYYATNGWIPQWSKTGTFAPKTTFCYVREEACPGVINCVIDNITPTSARAHWYPGQSESNWHYIISPTPLNTATIITANTPYTNVPNVTFNGLMEEQNYYLYIKGVCGNSGDEANSSRWVEFSFSTTNTCSAPLTAVAENTGDNEITFEATCGKYGTLGTYDYRYWIKGTTDTIVVTGENSQYIATDIQNDVDYDWEVRANCSGTDEGSSLWTAGNTVHVCSTIYVDATHPFVHNFDDTPFISECWVNKHVAGSSSLVWNASTDYIHGTTGQSAKLPDLEKGNRIMLVTPKMNIPAANEYEFSFWIFRQNTLKPNEGVKVWVNTTDTIGGDSLMHIRRGYDQGEITETAPGWYQYYATIPTSGNVYFILEGISEFGSPTHIDDVMVSVRPTHNVAYAAAPAALGSVAMTCGATDTVSTGVFYERTKPVFTATPDTCMIFTKWTNANGDSITNVNPWTLTVTADTSIIANFDTASYNLTVAVAPGYETLGTVEGSGTFKYMSENQFSATAVPHYHVVWNDGSYDAERTVVMPAHDTTFTATFVIDTFTVTTTQNVDSMGTISGAGKYTYGDTATITATPAAHHHFVEWSNGEITPQISVEVVKDTAFHATFRLDTVYVTALSNDDNLGQVSGSGYHGYNRPVTLIAHPEPHYHLKGWSNGLTGDTIVIYPTKDTVVTAYFVVDTFNISAVANNIALGTVTGAGLYPYNEQVTLVATPATGCHFVSWSNGSTNNVISFNATADSQYVATFAINMHNVTIGINDPDGGSVTGDGIYNYGDTAVLTATPAEHYQFAGWSDGDMNNPRTITVTQDTTFTATFIRDTHTITANAGAGGTVTGGQEYQHGAMATLTATANDHYHFVGWSNGVTTTTFSFIVTEDSTVTANFAIDEHNVTIGINDPDGGSITGDGIYNYGDTAVLTATPAEHYHFVGWSNGETDTVISVVVDGDINITATFEIDAYTISADITGAGKILGLGQYNYGSEATLIAVPDEGWIFNGWTVGGSVITGDTISVIVTCDTMVYAFFSLIPTSVEETETYNYVAYVERHDIVITGVAEHTVSVFDMTGRLVQIIDNASDIERVTVYASGVYVIRVDNLPVTRVVVK